MKINERQMPSKQESMGRTYASPSIKADGGDASQPRTCLSRSIVVRLQGVAINGDCQSRWCGLRQRALLPPPPGASQRHPSLQRRLTSFVRSRYAYDVDDTDNENNYSIVAKTYALATCPLGRCDP